MIRKATALVLLITLGLYLPAAGLTVCVCLNPFPVEMADASPCETPSCCEEPDQDVDPCCGNSECCIVIPSLPDGMEPQLIQSPAPASLPAPVLLGGGFAPLPALESHRAPIFSHAPPPPPGAPVRIAIGVWRL